MALNLNPTNFGFNSTCVGDGGRSNVGVLESDIHDSGVRKSDGVLEEGSQAGLNGEDDECMGVGRGVTLPEGFSAGIWGA